MRSILRLLAVLAVMLPAAASAQYVMDVGTLVTALRIGDLGNSIEQLDTVNSVSVARLSQIPGTMPNATLDAVLEIRQRFATYLRAVIKQKKVAMKALAIHHESVDEVIFITTTADNTAMLYVDDR